MMGVRIKGLSQSKKKKLQGAMLVTCCSPAKNLTFSGLMENPLLGKQLKSQLLSDPGKKGTLFGEDHFEWGSHQTKEKELVPLNN